MILKRLDLSHVAPRAVAGASGFYIIVRVWHLSREPAQLMPWPHFLLTNADLLGVLGSYSVVVWLLSKPNHRREVLDTLSITVTATTEHLSNELHQLRQVFTTLLLGLGLIERRARANHIAEVILLTHRLKRIINNAIENLRSLEAAREQLSNNTAVGEQRHTDEG